MTLRPRPTEYPLGELRPGWSPSQIRYAKLDFDLVGRNLIFAIINHRRWDTDDLDVGLRYARADTDGERPPFVPTPYDLKVRLPCYMILRLSGRNWDFRRDGDGAITTKRDLSDLYGGLEHLTENIVYFACFEPAPAQGHSFNFHVIFSQDGNKKMPLVLDPDIRFPGGTGDD